MRGDKSSWGGSLVPRGSELDLARGSLPHLQESSLPGRVAGGEVLAADAALVRPVPDEPGAVAHVVRLAVLGLLLRGGGGGERVVLRVGVRHDGFPSSPRRTAWSGFPDEKHNLVLLLVRPGTTCLRCVPGPRGSFALVD